jgi:hypothetical protein
MKTKESNEIVVYWCPWWVPEPGVNLDLVYQDPVNVFKDFISRGDSSRPYANFINCPAVSERFKRTFMVKNTSETAIRFDVDENNEIKIVPLNEKTTNTAVGITHQSTLKNNILFEYHMAYALFAEESLILSTSSPYFHSAPHMQYGAIVPGSFDIGKWYRPVISEFNLWEGNNNFHIQPYEPLMYWEFFTDKKIILKRYERTQKLYDITSSIVNYKLVKRGSNMLSRYKKFNESSLRAIILKEIKNNLVE